MNCFWMRLLISWTACISTLFVTRLCISGDCRGRPGMDFVPWSGGLGESSPRGCHAAAVLRSKTSPLNPHSPDDL